MANGKLLTIRNFAEKEGCTTQYIYILMARGDIKPTPVDGVNFIDTDKYSGIKKS